MGKILRVMKPFVYFINRTKEVREYVHDLDSTLAFDINGEKPFHFRIAEGEVSFHEVKAENPDVTLKADGDVFYKVLLGQLSQEEAFDKKLIVPEGAIVEAVRFRYIMNLVLEKNAMVKYLRAFLRLF